MKTCPYCQKDLPNDSVFCIYCGKSLDGKQDKNEKEEVKLKKNPRKNNWAILGLLLLLTGLFGFDFILGTVFQAVGLNEAVPFYISFVLYIGAIICGVLSLYVDKKDKSKGFEANGNSGFAYVSICLSLFTALANLSQVILK